MEQTTLGLLSSNSSDSSCGKLGLSNETDSSTRMEKDNYMDISKDQVSNDAELELGLGLSLACKTNSGVVKCHAPSREHQAAAKANGSSTTSAWGEYARILTAKDFPNGFPSRVAAAVSGNKRAAVDAEVGSASSNGVISSQVVGWPPIGAHRMNSLVNQAKIPNVDEGKGGVGGKEIEESSNKKLNHGGNNNNNDDDKNNNIGQERGHLGFVKVNVDGLPIGRKVDLNAHSCYESLAKALEEMFFKSTTSGGGEKDPLRKTSKLLDGSSEFVLTYEDKEGDWMLVGDVPWGMFLNTVKRLRIMKTSETNNGLAPRFQDRNGKQKGKAI